MFANLVNESSGVSCRVNIFVSVMFIQSEDFFYVYGCFKPAVCFLASAQFHVNFKILFSPAFVRRNLKMLIVLLIVSSEENS